MDASTEIEAKFETAPSWKLPKFTDLATRKVATIEPGQFTSVRFTERLEEIGARPSTETVADSYYNALAETTNGLYKTE